MNGQSSEPAATSLIEINLIADRVPRLMRRRFLARIGEIGTLAMLGLASLLFVATLAHLTTLMRVRLAMTRFVSDLKTERQVSQQLDSLRDEAAKEIGLFIRLSPVARRRVAWAPKLAALSEALPAGMGVHKVDVTGGDLFPAPKGKAVRGDARQQRKRTPHLTFSVIYLPSAGRSEDPMGQLRENLRRSAAFMDKMEFVRLEATAEEAWNQVQAQFFRGLLEGIAPDNDET